MTEPPAVVVNAAAAAACRRTAWAEAQRAGCLAPTAAIDPLSPPLTLPEVRRRLVFLLLQNALTHI
jgi:hypothetical protein